MSTKEIESHYLSFILFPSQVVEHECSDLCFLCPIAGFQEFSFIVVARRRKEPLVLEKEWIQLLP